MIKPRQAALIGAMTALWYSIVYHTAHGRDFGQWENEDPAIHQWYQTLMQPDNPTVSCCGEADAYWCDDPHSRRDHLGNVHNFCTISDDRSDEHRRRRHIDIGTEIEIPNNKMLKEGQGNPTGHGVVFMGPTGQLVYCYGFGGGL
jgi:hypothetical protein